MTERVKNLNSIQGKANQTDNEESSLENRLIALNSAFDFAKFGQASVEFAVAIETLKNNFNKVQKVTG